jgi:glycosyltransferase involved in cell wall biosynthesis
MTLSVAPCTFNGESYLLDQLESVPRPTQLLDELVVCDDRSEDGRFAVIDRFAHNRRGNACGARSGLCSESSSQINWYRLRSTVCRLRSCRL